MATGILTATTPEELAEQFPCTARPFAVWYLPEAEGNRNWAVNGEDGHACVEFKDMATALRTAAEMGKEWDEEAGKQAEALAEQHTAENATADIIQATSDYCVNMQAFFDLAEREIADHNTTDFDGMEFLVRAAKNLTFRLSALVCETQEKSEVSHA